MSLPLAIALYFIIWWTVLFAVLPFGVRTQDEDGVVVPGTPGSAPAQTRMLRVVLITSIAAAVVLAIVYVVMTHRLIDLDLFSPPSALPTPKK